MFLTHFVNIGNKLNNNIKYCFFLISPSYRLQGCGLIFAYSNRYPCKLELCGSKLQNVECYSVYYEMGFPMFRKLLRNKTSTSQKCWNIQFIADNSFECTCYRNIEKSVFKMYLIYKNYKILC